jgi:hypothetical protein
MATFYSPRIVTNGLVMHLDAGNNRSYPGTGTVWTDLSRSGNNGTLANGPTFNIANGGGVVFDGVDDYAEISTNTVIDNALAGQFTFEIWVMPLNAGLRYGKLFGKGTFNNQINGIVSDWNAAGPLYPIGFQYRDASNVSVGPSMGNVTFNSWYHLIITRNSSNLLSTFNNGIIASSASESVNLGNSAFPIRLSDNSGGERRASRIASFRFYTKGLSASEVLQNYHATKGRFGLL